MLGVRSVSLGFQDPLVPIIQPSGNPEGSPIGERKRDLRGVLYPRDLERDDGRATKRVIFGDVEKPSLSRQFLCSVRFRNVGRTPEYEATVEVETEPRIRTNAAKECLPSLSRSPFVANEVADDPPLSRPSLIDPQVVRSTGLLDRPIGKLLASANRTTPQ